jgi:hypothetical protein
MVRCLPERKKTDRFLSGLMLVIFLVSTGHHLPCYKRRCLHLFVTHLMYPITEKYRLLIIGTRLHLSLFCNNSLQ